MVWNVGKCFFIKLSEKTKKKKKICQEQKEGGREDLGATLPGDQQPCSSLILDSGRTGCCGWQLMHSGFSRSSKLFGISTEPWASRDKNPTSCVGLWARAWLLPTHASTGVRGRAEVAAFACRCPGQRSYSNAPAPESFLSENKGHVENVYNHYKAGFAQGFPSV
jgi:hypothetical protein